jgi:hypothetical protein
MAGSGLDAQVWALIGFVFVRPYSPDYFCSCRCLSLLFYLRGFVPEERHAENEKLAMEGNLLYLWL